MAKRHDWLKVQLPTFLRAYGRKRHAGIDPNDRHYSRELEEKIKRMDPKELDSLLRDDE